MKIFQSPQTMAEKAQKLAEEEAAKRDLPIDRICVRATPLGTMKVIVLPA